MLLIWNVNKKEGALNDIKALFGDIEEVPEVVKDEFAFITPLITEKEMKVKKEHISGLVGSIRTRF